MRLKIGRGGDYDRRGAESRLVELLRGRMRDTPPGADALVLRQNMVHYQSRLDGAGLNDSQRRAIANLVAEEEAQLHARRAP
ncbi:MAG: hypothetical protein ACK4UO_18295 [Pseudolabrys sp.]